MNQAIRSIEICDGEPNRFLVLDNEGGLWLHNIHDHSNSDIARLENYISSTGLVAIYVYEPYTCIVENYGTRGVVVDMRDGSLRAISRAGYHEDVTSYSIGFLKRNDHALLIHQTEWNRLDITDLDTNKLLTDRIIKQKGTGGLLKARKDDNFVDYFHSRLHVSPDDNYFLSNGWVWHPIDVIKCFKTESFLERYELSGFDLDYGFGYCWDRPCVFIDGVTFVIGADIEGDKPEDNEQQLRFYRLTVELESGHLKPFKKVECKVFAVDEYNELKGNLYFDDSQRLLIAMSTEGTFFIDLDGKIISHNKEIKDYPAMKDGSVLPTISFRYSRGHSLFYGFNRENNEIQTIPIDRLLSF